MRDELLFRVNTVEDDSNFLINYGNEVERSYLDIRRNDRPNQIESEKDVIYSIKLKADSSNETEIIQRETYSLFDLFSDIGGLS
jgi:hypothetical protein